MTDEQFILDWIRTRKPHCDNLAAASVPGNFSNELDRASFYLNLVRAAFRAMVRQNDGVQEEFSAETILSAALTLAQQKD